MIQEERFNTAEEFLDALRITNQPWPLTESQWESQWIFRGQRQANWKLIPSAWRTTWLDRFKDRCRKEVEKVMEDALASQKDMNLGTVDYEEKRQRFVELMLQAISELEAVREFVEFADRIGHPVFEKIPLMGWNNFEKRIRGAIAQVFNIPCGFAYPYPTLEVKNVVVALAQHHGIPTRLLDWTENPLVAAFFAAEAVEPNQDVSSDGDRIAVWALHRDAVREPVIHLYPPERSKIGYLQAQAGLFTFLGDTLEEGQFEAPSRFFMKNGVWPTLDEWILRNSPTNIEHPLQKLTLPAREAGTLLRLLWAERISRADLMPTYDNVTKSLELRAKWQSF